MVVVELLQLLIASAILQGVGAKALEQTLRTPSSRVGYINTGFCGALTGWMHVGVAVAAMMIPNS